MRNKQFFDFSKKTAFVLGGSGLIGSKVVEGLIHYGCKVINLDIKKNNNEKGDFFKFDYTQKKILKIILK